MTTLTAESCFTSAAFTAFWDTVYGIMLDRHPNLTAFIPDDGWYLDMIATGYISGESAEAVADRVISEIRDDWDLPYLI